MSHKEKPWRDPFTFSLRGMTVTGSLFIPPVLADDTINKAWDEKLRRADDEQACEAREARRPGLAIGRFWLSRRHGTT